mmetsp:Transcript_5515/g.14577  ORF Transcript_5515/g.14577 Transcript_5515/m.14577 type:complete len:229 (-) Transcript_5515:627-1313(-)
MQSQKANPSNLELFLPVRALWVGAQPVPLLKANGRLRLPEHRVCLPWSPLLIFGRWPVLGLHLRLEWRGPHLKVPAVPSDPHHGVLWDVDRRAAVSRDAPIAQQVGSQDAKSRLVRDDEEWLLVRVELKNQRLEPGHDVQVRLAMRIARRELVHLAVGSEALIHRCDLLLSHSVEGAGIDLVKVAEDTVTHLLPHRLLLHRLRNRVHLIAIAVEHGMRDVRRCELRAL